MIKAVGQVFRCAAIALIEPNGVESGSEGLVGESTHVMCVAGAFEAMKSDERRMLRRPRLPVAVGQHACAGSDVEEAGLRGWQCGKFARFSPRVQGHPVSPVHRGSGTKSAFIS